MQKLFLLLCLLSCTTAFSQEKIYTTANAHSHNDYEKPRPFVEAYKHQFGSIEADVFLVNGSDELYVAHHRSDLEKKKRTLDSLYLLPLVDCIRRNNGFVYADTSQKLQLMIDIKTEALPTLDRLVKTLGKYPELINSPSLRIVISGNRPAPDSFAAYPSFIFFDGVLGTDYSAEALSKIAMMSAPFSQFSKWNGRDTLPVDQQSILGDAIALAHSNKNPVRFWGAPDTEEAWKAFMDLQVDYINTDRVPELSAFIKKRK